MWPFLSPPQMLAMHNPVKSYSWWGGGSCSLKKSINSKMKMILFTWFLTILSTLEWLSCWIRGWAKLKEAWSSLIILLHFFACSILFDYFYLTCCLNNWGRWTSLYHQFIPKNTYRPNEMRWPKKCLRFSLFFFTYRIYNNHNYILW